MTLQMDEDFRSALEVAVAYRMTEMYSVPAEEARNRVRNFAKRGITAEYHEQVLAAGYDLFKPVLGASVPILRMFLQATISDVQAQIQRGQEAEQNRDA